MVTLDNFRAKKTFLDFDEFQTPSEAGHLCNSEADARSLTGISCTCGLDYGEVIILLLLPGAMIGLCLGVLL